MTQHSPVENTLTASQRLMWLVLATIALTIPLWYEIAAQPGNSVFAWRWTSYQALVESIASVLHLVIVIGGVVMLRKAVGDMEQWPLVRIGAWIWSGLVGLLAVFSVIMFNLGDNQVVETVEGDGYRINFVRIVGATEENSQLNVVYSCNHTLLYKSVLYLERLAAVSSVNVATTTDSMSVQYLQGSQVLREETYSLPDFFQRCRNG